MSEQTPSQAEGERIEDTTADEEQPAPGSDAPEVPRTTPSQAEGADDQDPETAESS
ncbi:hypothetical protein [Streptomyces cremeus]|uniref:Uncharacterized protein n=1 Tax=Streptomyces cremeus TaxID=66881 RepID=A0ABV5P6U6_STRCM